MEIKSDIRKRISEIRAIAKVSQVELARRMEISSSLVSFWEAGTRNPSQEQLQEIARHLGVSLDYLVKEKTQPAFQFRSKAAGLDEAEVAKVQLDASAQVEYIDEIFRLANEPIPQFLHMAEFSYPQLPRLAEHVRDTFRLNRRITLPGLKQAMAEQGIFVCEWNLPDNICGMSYRGSISVVFVNHQHQPSRKLFTLAHELAHLLFHVGSGRRSYETARVSFLGDNQDPEEREANAFASELLIPAADFEPLVKKHGDLMLDVSFMETIARGFNASRDAIFYRLCKLGLLDWKRDFDKYAAPFTVADPGTYRVTNIDGQVPSLMTETALTAQLKGKATLEKLNEWFYADAAQVIAHLNALKIVKSSN